ncbi:MAG: hypothetical protein M1814_001510 [Vezdaea aestivalis]|nr:MAG: hypothetical protein M1814_001510 [Vezdaea aestivalis]
MDSISYFGFPFTLSQLPLDLDLNPVAARLGKPHGGYFPSQRPLKIPLLRGDVVRQAHFQSYTRPTLASEKVKNRLRASDIIDVSQAKSRPSEYTQRISLQSTPGPAQNPRLTLAHECYGLPNALINNLEQLGIKSIYPWQSACLQKLNVLSGERNLVYEAPTGGGKSLVADVLMIKRVLEHPTRKAILVLPYIATVQEKLMWLRRLLTGVSRNNVPDDSASTSKRKYSTLLKNPNIQVTGFFGGAMARASWEDTDIAVCTIEKANALINTMILDETLNNLGALVMDELHMVNDAHRGHFLEMMTTKLLCLKCEVQIIGLSATFGDLDKLAQWLNKAVFYKTNYRPVPIQEYFVPGRYIYSRDSLPHLLKASPGGTSSVNDVLNRLNEKDLESHPAEIRPCRIVAKSQDIKYDALNSVVSLANETVRQGYGVLVFCGSRKGAERTAVAISEVLPTSSDISLEDLTARRELLENLEGLTSGYEETFDKTIVKGVGIHHAGLTHEERNLISEAFDNRAIRVVVATASLAAGVNLPARRVIIYGARMGRDFVGPAMLRQMQGRAGRKGKDELGESYICFDMQDSKDVFPLLEAELPSLLSSLAPEKDGLSRSLLEIVATKLAQDKGTIQSYINCSLLAIATPQDTLPHQVDKALQSLTSQGHIEEDDDMMGISYFKATQLGEATVAAYLSPNEGLVVYQDCLRALKSFALDDELQVWYLFTPLMSDSLSVEQWNVFLSEIDTFGESGMRAMDNLGVKPTFISRCAQIGGPPISSSMTETTLVRIHHRFYAALQLRSICSEMSLYKVAKKYHVERGQVQDLAKNCHIFAYGVVKFCEKMGWPMLQAVLEHMSHRLITGSKADLFDLCQIAYVKSMTARIFWEHGFKTVRHVANADPQDVMPLLLQAQPRKMKLKPGDDERRLMKLEAKAEIVVSDANRIWGPLLIL